jgi:hypothetical protein
LVISWNNATVPGSAATNNWTTGSNWTPVGPPDVGNEDYAVINNGGAAYVDSVVSQQPGGISLGTNAGESGMLDVLSGGSLTVVDQNIGAEDGAVRIGQVGTGNLFVRPGGTLNSLSLLLGGTATSSITLGGIAAGNTIINTGTVELNRATRVIGPNVNFSATGPLTLGGVATSRLIAEITAATHSPLKTTGTATLAGTLELDFNGFMPTVVDTWSLVDAMTIDGAFASIVPDPNVTLSPGMAFDVRTIDGGNGQIAQLYLRQLLVLTVNRGTGAVSITNPGASGVVFDGYGIQSAGGYLNPNDAVWTSLEEQPGLAGPDWFEANPGANHLAELRAEGTSTVTGGQAWSLGNVFTPPAPTQFGQNFEDLTFSYNDPVSNTTVTGAVQYTGNALINNLVLFVNPTTGQVHIRNTSPFTVEIDGYSISSAGGSLNSNPASWTSLQDQVGNTWAEANLSDDRVSELQSSGSTTLLANGETTFNLGGLFNTADPQDLVFEFVLANVNVAGDYNGNGIVDAADYTVWRDHLGQTFQLPNEVADTTPGMVTADDYAAWVARFGSSTGAGDATPRTGVVIYEAAPGGGGGALAGVGAGAVPEPASWLLACLGGLLMSALRPGNRT